MFRFNPVSPDPIDQQDKTCQELENETPDNVLKNSWSGCTSKNNGILNNPAWKHLTSEEKDAKLTQMCCKSILKCNNPNNWLEQNNIDATCDPPTISPYPHFGNISFSTKDDNTSSYKNHNKNHNKNYMKDWWFGVL